MTVVIALLLVVGFVGLYLLIGLRFINEYERAVVFRFGRLVGNRGPGPIIVLPVIERMERISMRIITLDVPAQEVMTRDNVPVEVNAVVYFRVQDTVDAVLQVSNYYMATSQMAQTTLRSVLGQAELDELLAEREKINQELQAIIDEQTDPWGVKVTAVEVKNVELPNSMQRAMARQAEAERERRAKIIAAEGEHQAAEKLHLASKIIGQTRTGIQLRFLQTLTEISSEETTTIAFPLPIDVFSSLANEDTELNPEDMPDPDALADIAGELGEATGLTEPSPEEPGPPDEDTGETPEE